jgi:nitrogen PTS system EIIA component
MTLSRLLLPHSIHTRVHAGAKRPLLALIGDIAAASTGLGEREIADALLQRERLGSTGIGSGIAIPHAKFTRLDALHGFFLQLDRPIDFEALDGQPVDLVFVLLAPEDAGADHLKALARVARVLRDPHNAKTLRETADHEAISQMFAGNAQPSRAA